MGMHFYSCCPVDRHANAGLSTAAQIQGEIDTSGPTVPTSALVGLIDDESVSILGNQISSQSITSDQVSVRGGGAHWATRRWMLPAHNNTRVPRVFFGKNQIENPKSSFL
jgi:hypothetical protein